MSKNHIFTFFLSSSRNFWILLIFRYLDFITSKPKKFFFNPSKAAGRLSIPEESLGGSMKIWARPNNWRKYLAFSYFFCEIFSYRPRWSSGRMNAYSCGRPEFKFGGNICFFGVLYQSSNSGKKFSSIWSVKTSCCQKGYGSLHYRFLTRDAVTGFKTGFYGPWQKWSPSLEFCLEWLSAHHANSLS